MQNKFNSLFFLLLILQLFIYIFENKVKKTNKEREREITLMKKPTLMQNPHFFAILVQE